MMELIDLLLQHPHIVLGAGLLLCAFGCIFLS